MPAVRALVRFETGSLLDDERPFAHATYDAVLCRNLLIYLTESARRRALSAVRAALAPGGVLYLGHAEVLVARAEGFAPAGGSATYACLATPPEAVRAAPSGRRAPRRPDAAAAASRGPRPLEAARSGGRAPVPVPAPALARKVDVLQAARDLADAGRLEEACALLEAEMTRGPSAGPTTSTCWPSSAGRPGRRARPTKRSGGRSTSTPRTPGRSSWPPSRPRAAASATWPRASTHGPAPPSKGRDSR